MTIAIYIRLSLEDDDLFCDKPESESITNQRNLLMDYIRDSPELCHAEVLEFCDDGYSGKNFDRPGVKRLLEAAKNGAVQCILVKDLSRFGRDYITVGSYVSRVFPFLGVRFIALNDHIDSSRKGDIDSIDTAFRTIIYDMYSRDLSKKVRSAKYQLAKRGVYINPVAPYGYQKSLEDKHILVPDPNTAGTVRRIFTLVAGGTSTADVARILNEEGIPTPSQEKAGTPSGHANWTDNYWRPQTVHWIIRDRQYIGSTVFGKRVRDRIGVHHQVRADLKDWVVVDDRHEPIVSKSLFQLAQEQLGEFRQTAGHTKSDNPLAKKVYCGVCGYAAARRGTANPYYCCMTPRVTAGMACFQEKIYVEDVLEAVTMAIRMQARYAIEMKQVADEQRASQEELLRTLQKELQALTGFQRQLAGYSEKLYEDLICGVLSKNDYAKQKTEFLQRRELASQREAEIRSHIAELFKSGGRYVEKYSSYSELDGMTSEIAADLLDRVTIWPDGGLDIKLRYLDEIPSALNTNDAMSVDFTKLYGEAQ